VVDAVDLVPVADVARQVDRAAVALAAKAADAAVKAAVDGVMARDVTATGGETVVASSSRT
jgi:hypothetical protein